MANHHRSSGPLGHSINTLPLREPGNLITASLVLGGIGPLVTFAVVKGDLEKHKRDGKAYEQHS